MTSGQVVPPSGLHRHQSANGAGRGHLLLQSTRHRRAAHQGGKIHLPLDTAVMQEVSRQRGAAATARTGLQLG